MELHYTEILRKLRSEIIAEIKKLVIENGEIIFAESTPEEYVVNYDLAVGYPDYDEYFPTVVRVRLNEVVLDNGSGTYFTTPYDGNSQLSTEDLANILEGCRKILHLGI